MCGSIEIGTIKSCNREDQNCDFKFGLDLSDQQHSGIALDRLIKAGVVKEMVQEFQSEYVETKTHKKLDAAYSAAGMYANFRFGADVCLEYDPANNKNVNITDEVRQKASVRTQISFYISDDNKDGTIQPNEVTFTSLGWVGCEPPYTYNFADQNGRHTEPRLIPVADSALNESSLQLLTSFVKEQYGFELQRLLKGDIRVDELRLAFSIFTDHRERGFVEFMEGLSPSKVGSITSLAEKTLGLDNNIAREKLLTQCLQELFELSVYQGQKNKIFVHLKPIVKKTFGLSEKEFNILLKKSEHDHMKC